MAAYTTIDDPEAYFQAEAYTGTGSTRTVTLSADTNMQPDWVIIKKRADNYNHSTFDSVRGVNKGIYVNETAAEHDSNADGYLSAFSSDGFQVQAGAGTSDYVNVDSDTYIAWCWKESATAGFDIVSYTGNGTDDTDISHNLSAVPNLIIVKNRSAADAWQVYHHKNTSAPETDYLVLDTAAASVDSADRWSDEAPTSSVFTLGDGVEVNTNTANYIAYVFAEKQGFSKFGSFTGNGNVDGTFAYTGFRPAFVMIKCASRAGTDIWTMYDNKRGQNVISNALGADVNAAERSSADIDFLSNGFKTRIATTDVNPSGETAIYMAFAESPFVNSNGVPNNAR